MQSYVDHYKGALRLLGAIKKISDDVYEPKAWTPGSYRYILRGKLWYKIPPQALASAGDSQR